MEIETQDFVAFFPVVVIRNTRIQMSDRLSSLSYASFFCMLHLTPQEAQPVKVLSRR
jgi:hypothetical protein